MSSELETLPREVMLKDIHFSAEQHRKGISPENLDLVWLAGFPCCESPLKKLLGSGPWTQPSPQ